MNSLQSLPDLSQAVGTFDFALFRYGLPALLGYVLHVGIAGRFGLRRPASLEERPAWFLGLWTALSVSTVLCVAMHLAYRLPLEQAGTLFRPAAWALGAALLPGCAVWLTWRSSVRRCLARDAARRADDSLGLDDLPGFDRESGADAASDALADPLDPAPLVLPPVRASDEAMHGDFDVIDDAPVVADDMFVVADDTPGPETTYVPLVVASVPVAPEPEPVPGLVAPAHGPEDGPGTGTIRYVPIAPAGAGNVDGTMHRELVDERRLREEMEKHLQVTRKALYTLDASARDDENARADTLIALESEIEGHVRRGASAEARATREECGRMQAETAASGAKREVLRLTGELRRNTEARARAVATAGKSVAFARRTLQARGQLEDRVRELSDTLDNRQATISSLIRALEAEKGRTQEQVASRARQLVLHERQLRERRGLEEVARSIEGKLSTRLVKKVARARPVEGV